MTAATPEEPSDEVLLVQLRDRDTGAFAVLYDRHSRQAFGLACRMLGDPSAAEDVVQEAFLSVWRQAESYRPGRSAVRTWLLSIVHHRAVDRFRHVAAREVAGNVLEGMPERADESVDVEEQAYASMESGRVQRALVALPPEQKTAIQLAYFDGLSASEIAQRLEVPLGTVKGRIRIGLQKMKATLDYGNLQEATHDSR